MKPLVKRYYADLFLEMDIKTKFKYNSRFGKLHFFMLTLIMKFIRTKTFLLKLMYVLHIYSSSDGRLRVLISISNYTTIVIIVNLLTNAIYMLKNK